MVAGSEYYRSLLESLHAQIQAIDTSDFQGATSDRFTQARFLVPTDGGLTHLETWIDLGGIELVERSREVHRARLEFICRFLPDDDSRSQARLHAAARAVRDALIRWSHPSGARSIPTAMEIDGLTPEWVSVRILFTLHVPRGA